MRNFLYPAVGRSMRLAIGACLLFAAGQAHAQSAGFGVLRATVQGNGTVLSSNGVISATRPVLGVMDVKFTRAVDACTAVVSLVGVTAGQASSQLKAGTTDTITVRTFDALGALQSRTFGIIVNCGP